MTIKFTRTDTGIADIDRVRFTVLPTRTTKPMRVVRVEGIICATADTVQATNPVVYTNHKSVGKGFTLDEWRCRNLLEAVNRLGLFHGDSFKQLKELAAAKATKYNIKQSTAQLRINLETLNLKLTAAQEKKLRARAEKLHG